MRVLLRADPRIRDIGEPWPDAVAPNAEVVYSANVLFLIEDAAEFLAAMSRHADRACYVAVAAVHSDAAIDPLWRIFHGRRLAPCPTYLDAVAILEELGARPRVDIVTGPPQRPWPSIASAVADLAENVAVGTNDHRRRLGKELRRWLLETPGGFITPMGVPTTALIHWAPRQGAG